MRLWRVSTREAFDGEGAKLLGARWNRPGTAVIYAAASLALATLEFLAHLDRSRAVRTVHAHFADVPDDVAIERLPDDDLPPGWRSIPAPHSLSDLGTTWVVSASTALLSVPSVVIRVSPSLAPTERNYLINPAHGDFRRIRVRSVSLDLDPRMWR